MNREVIEIELAESTELIAELLERVPRTEVERVKLRTKTQEYPSY
jgi:hypothetical protein